MELPSKLYKGAIGVKISIDTERTDLDDANVIEIEYIKPDLTEGKWTAVKDTDEGYETYICYVTQSEDDIDQIDEWTFHPYVEISSKDFKNRGNAAYQMVYEKGE